MSLRDEKFAATIASIDITISQAMQFINKGKAPIQDDDSAKYGMVRIYHLEPMSLGVETHALIARIRIDTDNTHQLVKGTTHTTHVNMTAEKGTRESLFLEEEPDYMIEEEKDPEKDP